MVCQDFGDGWGLLRPGPGALVGGVGRVVGDVGDAFGRPVVLDQDLAVDVGEGDGGGVPDRGGSVPGQGAADWIVLGFVEGWLCRGGCRGGGGVVSMVAVFGGGG